MAAVKVYTTRICGYCVAAKRLLKREAIEFDEIDVSNDPSSRHWLLEVSGQRTVPQIFIHDRSIGGYTELAALYRSGELDALLAAGPPAQNP